MSTLLMILAYIAVGIFGLLGIGFLAFWIIFKITEIVNNWQYKN